MDEKDLLKRMREISKTIEKAKSDARNKRLLIANSQGFEPSTELGALFSENAIAVRKYFSGETK